MAAPIGKEDLLAKFAEMGINAPTVEHPEVFTVEQALPHIDGLDGLFAKNLFLRDKKKSLWLYCAPHDADIKLNDLAKMVGAPGGFRFAGEDILYETLGVKQGCVTVFGLINDVEKKVKLILDSRFWDEEGGEGGEEASGIKSSGGGDGRPVSGDCRVSGGPSEEKTSVKESKDDGDKSQQSEITKPQSQGATKDTSETPKEEGNSSVEAGSEKNSDSKSEHRMYFHPLVNSASTGVTVSELKRFLEFTGHKPIIVRSS